MTNNMKTFVKLDKLKRFLCWQKELKGGNESIYELKRANIATWNVAQHSESEDVNI